MRANVGNYILWEIIFTLILNIILWTKRDAVAVIWSNGGTKIRLSIGRIFFSECFILVISRHRGNTKEFWWVISPFRHRSFYHSVNITFSVKIYIQHQFGISSDTLSFPWCYLTFVCVLLTWETVIILFMRSSFSSSLQKFLKNCYTQLNTVVFVIFCL